MQPMKYLTAAHIGLTICLLLTVFHASASTKEESCDPYCSVNVVDEHVPVFLQKMASHFGIQVEFEGDLVIPISAVFEQVTADEIVRSAAERGGYLVRKNGQRYTLYGSNVEEVTIAFTPRHLSPQETADKLGRLEELDILVLEEANSIVLRGTSEEVRRAHELLQTIDLEEPNVFIELMVVEYFHGDDYTWSYNIIDATKGKLSDSVILPGAGTVSGSYEAIADLPKSFRANLTALVQDNEAKVVTNPHIAVRSGQAGELKLKEELNIILTNETENFGVTRSLEQLEAGVQLDVTPEVLDAGYLDLKIDGEVSVFVPAPQGAYKIDRQTVTTQVLVKSGETLVIGGLVAKQGSVTDSGVPWLRRIPVLGYLFKSRTRNATYIETVIYITPYINDPDFFLPENIDIDVEEEFGNTLSID